MTLKRLLERVTNKDNFLSLSNYADFCSTYLEFIKDNLQAVIISRNENNYQFFQYKKDGSYNVTRPINNNLMFSLESFNSIKNRFIELLKNIKEVDSKDDRILINNYIYTCQQTIGATLDALPARRTNTARKINGDLFERFIRQIIAEIGIQISSGTISIPVKIAGRVAFSMKYQHDLIITGDEKVEKAIGSVKTSSKDRIDKIFIDKFLFNRLTDSDTPHFAIFLNDVQRKGKESRYGINTTFLSGHFKGYTIKLNPLDGVYYLDIRPNMRTEEILKDHIKTFDHFIISDVWKFVE